MGSQPETMIFKISVSVWRMPSRASWPTLSTVASTPSLMMPSPGRKQRPCMAMLTARMAASTLEAILAAQEGLAPSQTMPETLPRVLTMTFSISAYPPP